jgi:hypothetical protein
LSAGADRSTSREFSFAEQENPAGLPAGAGAGNSPFLKATNSEMSKHTVIVWSESCTIDVCRKHKTVWVASGDYKGATITVQVQTEGAAIKRWREAAQYLDN